MEKILETKGLAKAFGGLLAVDHVNLSLEKGELRALIGPNGCGKTTLFNLMTGKFKPTKGKVFFKGEDITGLPIHEIAQRGIIRKFQIPSVYDPLTVLENIRIAYFSHQKSQPMLLATKVEKHAHQEIMGILRQIRLDEKTNELAGNLSHGEKQWLEIGMAVASKAELLLLDEPTTGLTIGETKATVQLIRRICDDFQVSILVIEHDISFVREIQSRVTVMCKGCIIREGSFDEIQNDELVKDIYLGKGD